MNYALSDNDEEEPISLIVRQSTSGTLILDLNVDLTQEFESPLLKLNVDRLHEEDEENINIDPNQEVESPLHEEDEEHIAVNLGTDNINIAQKKKRIFLSNEQRWSVYRALLEKSVNGKLKKSTTKQVFEQFSVPIRAVQRIWRRTKETPDGVAVNVSHKKTRNCGRKRIHVDLSRMHEIPLHRRTTLKALAEALDVSYTMLFRLLKQGLLRRHTNAIKSYLKKEHKIARLKFCISMLDPSSLPHEPKFVGMYNMIHIDEKWFYMTKKTQTYYLLPNEEVPLRTCQSKNFIGKVMFLVAMARPRYDDDGNEVFSGKLGVLPFVTMERAQRSSRNREAGTWEIKPMTSVKRENVRAYMIEKVIPAIQNKWPREDVNKTIFIQQDNARTHIDLNDEAVKLAASQTDFDIRLACQPSNSSDLNILDLVFFASIQALQHKECPRTVQELIHAVERAFDEYPSSKVNDIFLSTIMHARDHEDRRFEQI